MKTIEAAQGKWIGILSHFGVNDSFLQNRHGPCPLCDGTDRYRFDDKDGNGTYYCNHCGAGNGFDLAMKYTGKSFAEVAKEIDQIVGNIDRTRITKTDGYKIRKRIQSVIYGLEDNSGITPVRLYLRGRGLPYSKSLKFHPGLQYWDDGKCLGTFPAMVASIRSPSDQGLSLHITHLTDKGHKAGVPAVKKILPPIDKLNGSAIRLTEIYPHIGIAEGIETALAVMRDFNIPCWAAINSTLMEQFIPPEGVTSLTIFADNDHSFTGQKAAYSLANKLFNKMKVNVIVPDFVGDFADVEEAKS